MAFVLNHHVTDKNVLEQIRKESLDVYNRLHSIAEDATFVEEVHRVYPDLPILPNLRCGAWYSNPAIAKDVPAYFKSTDGHFHNWSFNLRRSNLHLVPLIEEWKGVVLVDSTRSGKRIPDALSKTVPIWCAVINRATALRFPRPPGHEWDTCLYTPPGAVSAQEHHRIEQLLDTWADDLHRSSFELPNLSSPLRPFWITPATSRFPSVPKPSSHQLQTFLPVICLSASKKVDLGTERRTVGFSYVQGSGDDHELWSMGLTPDMFWAHKDMLLQTKRAELPELIERLVSQKSGGSQRAKPDPIARIGGSLLICRIADLDTKELLEPRLQDTAYILIDPSGAPDSPEATEQTDRSHEGEEPGKDNRILRLHLDSGKRGQHEFLRRILPSTTERIRTWLAKGKNVCIACETGKDASVGVALAAVALFFNEDGEYLHPNHNSTSAHWQVPVIDKSSIRTRLQWIIASRPIANPSRATLKRVNEFLLTPRIVH